MQPGGTNILDQLLGGFGPQLTGMTGAQGVSAQADGSAGMFEALLAQAAQTPNDLVRGPLNENTKIEPPVADDLFPSLDQPVAMDTTPADQTVLTVTPDTLIEAVTNLPVGVISDVAVNETGITTPQTKTVDSLPAGIVDQTTVAQITIDDTDLPLPTIVNKSLQQLLNKDRGETVTMESGTYRVLNQKISGGALELTVASKDSPDEPVKITLPVDLLKPESETIEHITNKDTARPVRIPLGNLGNNVAKTETRTYELLAKLNLKELKLEASPTGSEKTTARPGEQMVQVELIAEQSGQAVVIKSRLGLQPVRVESGVRNILKGGDNVEVSDKPAMVISTDNDSSQKISPADRVMRQQAFGDPVKMIHKNLKLTSHKINRIDTELLPPNFINDEMVERNVSQPAPKVLPTVKLTLPQPELKSFSANGQTLMLRIEPEQLGPARLNLSLHDGLLTARVIVDTPLAKMAVEHSLEQLTDQLSRAGVEVDKINVSLSDSYAQERFFDRHPAWSFNRHNRRFDNEDTNDLGPADLITAAPIINTQYVGTRGVNLLA